MAEAKEGRRPASGVYAFNCKGQLKRFFWRPSAFPFWNHPGSAPRSPPIETFVGKETLSPSRINGFPFWECSTWNVLYVQCSTWNTSSICSYVPCGTLLSSGARLAGWGHPTPRECCQDQRVSVHPRESAAMKSAPGLGWFFLAHALADFKLHLACALIRLHDHVVPVQHLAVQDLQRQRILHQLLDGPLQRTCTEIRVKALGEEQVFRGIGQLERNLALGQQTAHIFQAQLDDLHQLLLAQRAEEDDVIHPVEELRLEVPVQGVHYLLRGLGEILLGAQAFGLQER